MKNILVFSFFPSFLPPKSGGEVRLFNFYFELSKYFNITLLSSGDLGGDIETISHSNNFIEKRVPKDSNFVDHWTLLTPHAGDGDLSGPCIHSSGRSLTQLHKIYLESYSESDIIVHDFPFTVNYDLFMGLDKKPRIYNSHNCEFELYKKLHSTAPSNVIIDLVQSAEIKALCYADFITYCGENDLAAFEKIAKEDLNFAQFIPNGMTISPNIPRDSKNNKKRAIFIGSGHLPNVEAANYIVDTLAPRCPDITFDIVGGCLPPGKYPSNVIRHGILDLKIKADLMASATIAVNPIISGSGSSLKIMDFVSYGIPVLSTHVGMRGFEFRNNIDCFLREIKEFPTELNKCIALHDNLEKMGISAKKYAIENYAWRSIAEKFKSIIDNLSIQERFYKFSDSYVLALNDYDPFGSVGGGATRLNGLYSAISEWSNVVVLCFSNESTIEVKDISPRIKCIYIPKTPEHISEEKYFNGKFHISVNDIVALRHAGENAILNSVYAVLRENAKIIVCDHPYMVSLPDRFNDRFVYSSHNFEYGLKKSLLEWHPDKQLLIDEVLAAEELCVASSAAVVAVSQEDANNLARGVRASAQLLVVPNGAAAPTEPSHEDIEATKTQISKRSAVFLGSAHMPNVDAAKYIIENLAIECSNVEFHIIGSVCNALSSKLPENIKPWGVLSDGMKSAVMQQCAIAINPMFSGSGSNIKLADFIANGLHVVSTSFGVRGYPNSILSHITLTTEENFSKNLLEALNNKELNSAEKRKDRKFIFTNELSMNSLAGKFVDLLKNLEKPKKRMLFVTQRYTAPTLGGAESMLATLMGEIGKSGYYDIDIIAAEVSYIDHVDRFGGKYEFDPQLTAPTGLENVRFARFPVTQLDPETTHEKCVTAWRAQSEFEKQFYLKRIHSIDTSGLAWGWGYPEAEGSSGRWGFSECGIHVVSKSHVNVKGFVPKPVVLLVRDSSGSLLIHRELESYFEFSIDALPGAIEFYFSINDRKPEEDSRPLAFYAQNIAINGDDLDLSAPTVFNRTKEDPLTIYHQMEAACRASRARHSINLTEIRGPHCPEMETFISQNIEKYDILVTHNSVFRTATFAINAAKHAGVPSILIPHAHLDDDFYHFPDVHQAALDATLVLAAPKAACKFYEQIGVQKVDYLPSGIDISEKFTEEDEINFRSIYKSETPFFLVLGRKSGAKGYSDAIKSIEEISRNNSCHLVLIGPDDDGIPVDSKHATYLGQQPRSVLRGALKSCLALVNMSSSESFGIVLLEAWRASRPVIANSECSAFRDLVIDNNNGLLVDKSTLSQAMKTILLDSSLRSTLGTNGKKTAEEYSWDNISKSFLSSCISISKK